MLLAGTVLDIPFPVGISNDGNDVANHPYSILFDNSTSASIPLSKMVGIIPKPPVNIQA
jgi:hypothetical protein